MLLCHADMLGADGGRGARARLRRRRRRREGMYEAFSALAATFSLIGA